MSRFREQALRFGTDVETAKVSRVDLSASPFGVWVGAHRAGATHRAKAVIVSTGAQSLMLGLPEESRLLGHGLSTCATCDGVFFRDHDIAVVGGGDSRRRGGHVPHQVRQDGHHRAPTGRTAGVQIMRDRAMANEKIRFAWNSTVTAIHAREHRRGHHAHRHPHRRGSPSGCHRGVRGYRTPTEHRPLRRSSSIWKNGYLITHSGSLTNVDGSVRLPVMSRTTSTARPSPPPFGLHGRHRRRTLARSGNGH